MYSILTYNLIMSHKWYCFLIFGFHLFIASIWKFDFFCSAYFMFYDLTKQFLEVLFSVWIPWYFICTQLCLWREAVFISSLQICVSFISFSLLIVLAGTFIMMLKHNVTVDNLHLFLILGGRHQSVGLLYQTEGVFFYS